MTDSVRTIDKLDHGQTEVQAESRQKLKDRHRVIARGVITDLRLALREMPGWTEWQKNVLSKAVRDLGDIR